MPPHGSHLHLAEVNHPQANALTTNPDAPFFLAPEIALHRQYEALRACFVEQLPGPEIARRFAYSPGAFRVLCRQFRHDPAKCAGFFQTPKHGPQSTPVRDRVRSLAVAMRKKNLSIYDIQRELPCAHWTQLTARVARLNVFS